MTTALRPAGALATRAPRLSPRARRVLGSPVLAALTQPHGVSHYLELVNPRWSLEENRAVVTAVRRESADAVTLTLRPERWDGFRAGQHVLVTVEIDGRRHTRSYSPCSSQHRGDGQLQLTVKAHPEGRVSRHLQRARAGLVVGLSAPIGEFTLPARPGPVVLVSGGSGITPVLSMLRTLVDEGHDHPITFLHYVRTMADLLHADELAALAAFPQVDVRVVTTRESRPHARFHGHLVRDHLPEDLADAELFACGPYALVAAMRDLADELGVAERLRTEAFEPAPRVADADATGELRFRAADVAVTNDGRTVLEQAEAAGLSPAFGCRMGICHTCTRRKPSGTVRNVVTGDRCHDDTTIQLCVSVPEGDVEIDL